MSLIIPEKLTPTRVYIKIRGMRRIKTPGELDRQKSRRAYRKTYKKYKDVSTEEMYGLWLKHVKEDGRVTDAMQRANSHRDFKKARKRYLYRHLPKCSAIDDLTFDYHPSLIVRKGATTSLRPPSREN